MRLPRAGSTPRTTARNCSKADFQCVILRKHFIVRLLSWRHYGPGPCYGGPEIFIIPDILCNAGGVVVSYFEWVQDLQSFFWSETEVTDKLFRILEGAFTQILAYQRKNKLGMRTAALSLGIRRLQEAKRMRGLFP